ncbi:alpha/beta hydrolase [Thermospira aquatica]|uniref:Esterase n=1 Tax=Thermospira aquatica TaxID=2828656 RepID=A0AAX3BC30_9SPIR|nr:alpha/beta hydrolase-fold protein [Thermospira aquatica]URA09822.1 hypothetical protein KDW03_10095 [Thermospira aquatica]
MRKMVVFLGILVLFGCEVREETSDKLTELFRNLDSEGSKVSVYQSWASAQQLPLIEKGKITFVLWDEKAEKVILESPLVKNKDKKLQMKRYKNTGLFYVSLALANEEIVDYSFIRFGSQSPNGRRIQDPHHPFIAYTKPIRSRVIMPGVKKGQLIISRIEPQNGLAARRIFIYLPSDYNLTTNRYPVIYMQDGQNLWDSPQANFGGWKVDTTLDRLIAQGKIDPVIVVGIENSSARAEEYVGFSAYYLCRFLCLLPMERTVSYQ